MHPVLAKTGFPGINLAFPQNLLSSIVPLSSVPQILFFIRWAQFGNRPVDGDQTSKWEHDCIFYRVHQHTLLKQWLTALNGGDYPLKAPVSKDTHTHRRGNQPKSCSGYSPADSRESGVRSGTEIALPVGTNHHHDNNNPSMDLIHSFNHTHGTCPPPPCYLLAPIHLDIPFLLVSSPHRCPRAVCHVRGVPSALFPEILYPENQVS